jgi:hypothetical protein
MKNRVSNPPFTLAPVDVFSDIGMDKPDAKMDMLDIAEQPTDPPPQPTTQQPSQPETPLERQTEPSLPDTSREARYAALADGHISVALEQGSVFQASLQNSSWTIRLIMACKGDSLQYCAQTLAPLRPEFFLRPFSLRNGGQCYQLFVGVFPNKSSAETEMKKLLPLFERRVDPKVIRVGDISLIQ